jgi:hypothetical protein
MAQKMVGGNPDNLVSASTGRCLRAMSGGPVMDPEILF